MAKRKKTRRTRRDDIKTQGTPSPHRFTRQNISLVLALALLVAVSYFPVTQAGFLWDDITHITPMAAIEAWSGIADIWFSPTQLKEKHYWPMVYTSFWLEHKLWGFAPAGYHIVNVLLHLVNVLLLWRLMLRLTVPGAWLIAAVFAVHPTHVESVAWIIERKDVLSALFYLTAVLAYLRFLERESQHWYYVLALVLFCAGMLSKSIVVTLPAALLIVRWWMCGRIRARDLLHTGPFFAVGLCIAVFDMWFVGSRAPVILDYSMAERTLIASRALWFYVGKLLWPVHLIVIYPHWDVDSADLLAWGWVVAAVAVAALLWFCRQWIGRGPLAGALFFAVTLSPVLGFIDFGYMLFSFVADRFQYLAGIGVLAVLLGAAAHGVERLPLVWKKGALGLAGVVLVILGTLTYRQAGLYRDPLTFFGYIVSHNDQARDAHLNLGYALHLAGRLEEELAAARIAAKQRPDSHKAHFNIGAALLELGEGEEAIVHFRRALDLDPENVGYLHDLSRVYNSQGRYAEALALYDRLLDITPDNASAHVGRGEALFHLRRYDEATQALAQGRLHNPDAETAFSLHILMGQIAWEARQSVGEATEHYERALEIDPRNTGALADLASLRMAQARYRDALALFRRATEIDDSFARGHSGVGVAFFYLGEIDEARGSFERALSLNPNMAEAHHYLAQINADK